MTKKHRFCIRSILLFSWQQSVWIEKECMYICVYEYEPTLVTHIWLVVRVPVLSEQMTEVQPRVSTEGKLLTMAFFFAIRRVPRARQVVMTAGRPDGQMGMDEVQRKKRYKVKMT